LTRRANHRHIRIIEKILKARAGKSAAGFFVSGPFEPEFLNRTAAAFPAQQTATIATSQEASQSAPPSELLDFAGTRERARHAAWTRSALARGPDAPIRQTDRVEDRVRA
jgi:hypothetical protein